MKRIIALIMVSLLSIAILAGCGNGGGGQSPAKPGQGTDTPAATDSTGGAATVDDKAADLSKIDIEIAFEDYSAMNDLDLISNAGKVIKITGLLDKFSSYSIVEDNGAGSSVGASFFVDGFENGDYPAIGTKIRILGVIEVDGWDAKIKVLPENFEVLE